MHQLNGQWDDAKKSNYTKHALREYAIHKDLTHPYEVRLHDVFEIDASSFATVLEMCQGGDLDQRLKTEREIPEADAKPILLQVDPRP